MQRASHPALALIPRPVRVGLLFMVTTVVAQAAMAAAGLAAAANLVGAPGRAAAWRSASSSSGCGGRTRSGRPGSQSPRQSVLLICGNVYCVLVFADPSNPPVPSAADLFYLAEYPMMFLALGLLIRNRAIGFRPSLWIDGLVATLSIAGVWTALDPPAVAHAGSILGALTLHAYVVGDIVLAAGALGTFALFSWRPGVAWIAIAGGLAVQSAADLLTSMNPAGRGCRIPDADRRGAVEPRGGHGHGRGMAADNAAPAPHDRRVAGAGADRRLLDHRPRHAGGRRRGRGARARAHPCDRRGRRGHAAAALDRQRERRPRIRPQARGHRRPDRARQPPPAVDGDARGLLAARAVRHAHGRPGRLQGGERRPRTRRRRHPAAGRRRSLLAARAPRRRARPPRRRRVRGARARLRPGRCGGVRAPARRGAPRRLRRPGHQHQRLRQRRHRHRHRRRHRAGAPAPRRRRDVRGQAGAHRIRGLPGATRSGDEPACA